MRPDVEEFFRGISFDAYRLLGAHPAGPGRGWLFTLWAPHARRVQLLGDWNGWDLYSAAELIFCEDGLWRGHTPNYLEVCAESGENLHNQLRQVALTELSGTRLIGKLVEA